MYFRVLSGMEREREYRLQCETIWTRRGADDCSVENFHRFCGELEKKGVQILENNVKIHIGQNLATAKGTLTQLNRTCGETEETEIIEVEQKTEGEQ